MNFGGKEPVFWITLGATIIVGVITTLSGQGILSDAMAGKITDGLKALVQILTLLAPVIAGLIARKQVTPIAAPVLPMDTPVSTPTGAAIVTKAVA